MRSNFQHRAFVGGIAVAVFAVGVCSAGDAAAGIVNTLDSSSFEYRYEMDEPPNNQDLNNGGGDDWWDLDVPAVQNGFAVNTAQNQIYRGDFALNGDPSIWRLLANAADADWTFEIRVAKRSGTQGPNGWFGIAQANAGESNSSTMGIMDDRIRFNGTDYLQGGAFGNGEYQVIRIAHDAADNELYAWVNGILLNDNLSTPIAGANGTAFDNSTFIGDYGSGFAGDWSIDYMRLHSTAVGPVTPVPEPDSYGFAGLGLAMAGWAVWKRRRIEAILVRK